MANFPDVRQIGGKHYDVYEAYYRSLDPKSTNQIGAMDAARFLKKSGLSDVVLSRVWDCSDPAGRGFLDKTGFFVGLKLVSLAQAGENINVKNLLLETNAPRCGDVPKMKPPPVPKMTHPGVPPHPSVVAAASNTDWTIKPDERAKYQQLFNQLQPENGVLPGNKVVGVLRNSKLPTETLSTIWELADQDKDGSLDEHEFIVAMHLVYKALDSRAIPSSLPKELLKPAKADDFGNGGFVANFPTDIVPVAPVVPPPARPAPPASNIPVAAAAAAAVIAPPPLIPSVSKDGWVLTTVEKLKYQEVFEKSDLDKDGLVSGLEIKDIFLKSGLAQNLLAHIWALCDTHQSGKLNSEQFALAMWLIDRKKKGMDPPQVLAPEMIPPSMRPNAAPPQPPKPIFTNPELQMISKEIEELAKERHLLEADVAQKEADVRIKTGEVRSLHSELDTLTATLKQLETQREQAQKRLDDILEQVKKLKEQCQKQEDTIKEQESELDSRKQELQKLKDEEQGLLQEYESQLKEKEKISGQLQDTQLQISQARAMVTQLEEIKRQMSDALALCKVAIEESNPVIVSDYSLGIEPEFRDFKAMLQSPEAKPKDDFEDDFSAVSAFKVSQTSTAVEFDSFNRNDNAFNDDGFSNKWSHPFGSQANDPFSASGGGSTNNVTTASTAGKDAFDSDPFAALHAPPKGSSPMAHAPESPSPALPPKQAKKPPPRPAPPRPALPKAAAPAASGDSFANFDDFDLKAFSDPVISNFSVSNDIQGKSADEKPASDFQEDPFKNYRYEDPFLIEDPFKDENGNEEAKIKTNKTTTTKDKFDEFFAEDDDFDKKDFGAAFETAGGAGGDRETKINNNGSTGKSEKFDPFGLSESALKTSTTDEPAFGFEADFANFDAFNNNGNDSFDGSNGFGKSKKKSRVKKFNTEESAKISKLDFSDDYEKDLQSVLSRSMVDQ